MGDAKGCEFVEELARPDTPATDSTLCKRVGGRTISRSALGEVVRGCPPASRVSSRSYGVMSIPMISKWA